MRGFAPFKRRTMLHTLIHWSIRLSAVLAIIAAVSFATNNKLKNLSELDYNSKYITMAEREKQLSCLSKNIYFEAGRESFEGKVAVAQVTMNRVNSGVFPNDICDVVFQKTKVYDKFVCQFTWSCERGPKVKSNKEYAESQEVAKKVLLENFRLPSLHGAMYYHADYVNPNWNLPKITKIGRHIFYGARKS